MKTMDCAICGNRQRLEELYPVNLDLKKINSKTFSARRFPDKIHYLTVKCKNCGLIFSREIFPENKIVNLYKKSGFHYNLESKYLGKTYLGYFKKFIGLNNDLRVLDIGAGNGFFLNELVKAGVKDVWGIEPGKPSVDKASKYLKSRIVVDILKKNLFAKNSFDVICCFHTLDHIIEPNEFLKVVYSLLKPGGKIFFVVHNTDGLSVKLFGEKSPIFDVEHIYLFNKSTLARIFKKNNFKKTYVFSHFNTYPLIYWFRLLPIPLSIKQSVYGFLSKSKVGLFPLKINPGNIGIIAQK